jgi:sugar O-acyltransferase (sialic acid O-acetyltransferase NeuD family)
VRDLVILGTGGFAREVHQLAEDVNADRPTWNVLGFLDDEVSRAGEAVHGLPVLGARDWLNDTSVSVAVGVGVPATRWRIVDDLQRSYPSIEFPTLVHPLAWIGNRIELGPGTIVCTGVRLTTDLVIRDHVQLNLDVTVGHDSVVHPFATVAPGVNISGRATIGEGCDLGTGVAIIQGISIGAWTIVGAGAVVVRDIPANVTAVGAPAKPIKERPEGWHRG